MTDLQTFDKPSLLRASDGKTALRQLSHTATRTRDMEATRRFNEDFLGLPMVAAMQADFDVVTNKPSNYIHCFFQLADNSCIAFFQFEDGFREQRIRLRDQSDRHSRNRSLLGHQIPAPRHAEISGLVKEGHQWRSKLVHGS